MLMNVDVEKVVKGLRYMHEFWCTMISIGISLYLLDSQLGLSFLAPLLLLVIFITVVLVNGGSVAPHQKKWLGSTQERVTFITGIIASMKNVKLLGLVPVVQQMGIGLRVEEVEAQR